MSEILGIRVSTEFRDRFKKQCQRTAKTESEAARSALKIWP